MRRTCSHSPLITKTHLVAPRRREPQTDSEAQGPTTQACDTRGLIFALFTAATRTWWTPHNRDFDNIWSVRQQQAGGTGPTGRTGPAVAWADGTYRKQRSGEEVWLHSLPLQEISLFKAFTNKNFHSRVITMSNNFHWSHDQITIRTIQHVWIHPLENKVVRVKRSPT